MSVERDAKSIKNFTTHWRQGFLNAIKDIAVVAS